MTQTKVAQVTWVIRPSFNADPYYIYATGILELQGRNSIPYGVFF